MQKDLGGLPPEQALDYMEKTPDLVIVNVAGRGFWDRNFLPAAPSSCTAAAATWWSTGTSASRPCVLIFMK